MTLVPRALGTSRREFDLLVVAVPDRLIQREARRLSRAGFRGSLAIHLSGALGADALQALFDTGTPTASFHPLRSFSGRKTETFAGCVVALEGSEPALRLGRLLALRIGARAWKIDSRKKALYHAAAAVAAGGTATLLALSSEAAAGAGMPPALARASLARLSQEAAENVRRLGFRRGLTGPLARGDKATLDLHRKALRESSLLAKVYETLLAAARTTLSVDRRGNGH